MTTPVKRIGFGVVLSCDPTGGTSFAALGAIVDGLDGGDAKADEVDTSLLSDKYKSKAGAQVDLGKVSFAIAYDPKDTATNTVLATLLQNSNVANFQIAYPAVTGDNGTTPTPDTFKAFVSGFKRTIKKTEMIKADIELTLAGGGNTGSGYVGV